MKILNLVRIGAVALLATVLVQPAQAQLTVSDTLNSTKATNTWTSLNGACLTAGSKALSAGSSIPGCTDLAYYSGTTQVGGINGTLASPDPDGQGALRLTNGGSGGTNKTGSVVSTVPFPTNQGVQLTFSTVTYGGNGYSNGASIASGADGLVFFLIDGTVTPTIGAFGGSLGYSCSQGKSPADGATGGYLAVATDEFGNFSNKSDSTSDGTGPNPGTITVRGSGSVTWAWLNKNYPAYYPGGGDNNAGVQKTCASGYLYNWTAGQITDANKVKIGAKSQTTEPVRDYQLIGSPIKVVAPIFTQENVSKPLRSGATLFTYSLTITQDGYLSLSYVVNGSTSIQTVLTKQSITATNGALPTSFLFGFAAGTGGGSNVHEITCFKAATINTATNSAGTNVQSNKLQTGAQIYLSYYHPLNSWGQLTATLFDTDATTGLVTIDPTAKWDAKCVLTGGSCTSTSTAAVPVVTAVEDPMSRVILTSNGTASATVSPGMEFTSTNLTKKQGGLMGSTTADTTYRVAYLRGDRSQEVGTTGASANYRKRDGVLGDIRNASPVWVGPPTTTSYTATGYDKIGKTTIAELGTSYTTFIANNKTRTNIVYSGANDGMLHGFRAGAYDTNSKFVDTNNDGKEVIAYVPDAVVTTIHSTSGSLDFSSQAYSHNAYVDATPGTGDLYYAGAWHTWLVGGLGAGGNATGEIADNTSTGTGAIYALDVTKPDSTFSAGAATTVVLGEWNSSNITCTNVANCGDNLGNVYGTPVIRRLHDGNWAAIFGNGRNSKTGAAGIFIMSVNITTGARTFLYLDTNTSSTTSKNGIDFVTAVDLDSDHVTDYVYAGDKAGNVWRFDLLGSTSGSWAVRSTPVYTTSTGQPISTAIVTGVITQATGAPRLVLNFGTGRQAPATFANAATYATGTQAMYGIWDWDMTSWNSKTNSSYQLVSATTQPTGTLTQQSYVPVDTSTNAAAVAAGISGARTSSQNPICWYNTSVCSTPTSPAKGNAIGWTMPLTTANEQIIYAPTVTNGILYFNTFIPGVSQTLSCTSQAASGYTMAVSPESGAALNSSAFASASAAVGIVTKDPIVGLGLSATGSVSVITTDVTSPGGSKSFIAGQTTTGTGFTTQIDPAGAGLGKRVTWIKLR